MELNLKASIVFQKNYDAVFNSDKRFVVNQGSSRSSKTYSICQLLIVYALQNPNEVISIVRKTFPTLRASVMRDFFEVLNDFDLYKKSNHNKSENIYKFDNGTIIEFFSADDEQKLRGRKRNICWVNEANELLYDDFFQLNLRTAKENGTAKLIFDYNPSDSNSWLYKLPSEETYFIKSTFRDNPFLDDNTIKQIEQLKYLDPEMWSIFGMGERTNSRLNIWYNWEFVDKKPDYFKEYIMGIDFGFNHPTVLTKVYFHERELFVENIIHESYLTTTDLINKMNELGVDQNVEIMADWARPEIIQEMKLSGYNVHPANKSVKKGIDNVKQFKVYGYSDDKNMITEFENYKWRKVGDRITDEPVKEYDDISDAIRYATYYIKEQYYDNSPMLFF